MIEALNIQVKGIVQGVGFRPFVYRLAKKYLVNGWVLNAVDGVHIHAEGEGKLLDEFVLEISDNAPAAARVEEIYIDEVPLEDFETFEIRFSEEDDAGETTLVSPDLAMCDDCANELFDPADRRFRYPFINCTNCGPRFTIIDELPYDRAKTSMAAFFMCADCDREYRDPVNRRFHAQPDACFECGPHVTWCEIAQGEDGIRSAGELSAGITREESDAIIERAIDLLLSGKIIAVKGLGGFHLVCDADNALAVAALRERKHRPGKAFAVMGSSVAALREVCCVDPVEEMTLRSAAHPIVLLKKNEAGRGMLAGVADGLDELGAMLPYTPLQALLLHDFAQAKQAVDVDSPALLVMTSGNLHDEPIVTDDYEARERLLSIADAFVGNDRAILSRYDDSVVRIISAGQDAQAIQFIRRARGYAPLPLVGAVGAGCGDGQASEQQPSLPSVFATGPEQKNTFVLTRGCDAFVSQHVGDLENAETYDAWLDAKARYERLFEIAPAKVACDMHPEYLSSKWAAEQPLPVTKVQHHHAHIASVLGEHGIEGAVCGIAFDGTGYGADGSIWGGEVLLANKLDYERFVNFAYVPMPGGAACVKHPLRMAYGVLWAFDLLDHPAAAEALDRLGDQGPLCESMIEQGLNTPMTSSVGRLFDAASALLGVCIDPSYEGEPAIMLEAAAHRVADAGYDDQIDRYVVNMVKNTATESSTAHDTSVALFDAESTFRAMLDDMADGVDACVVARRFHDAMVQAVLTAAEAVRILYGIETVVLSGGVFMNRYLVEKSIERLQDAGLSVAINRDLPPNDGCVSFGQAVVACAKENE